MWLLSAGMKPAQQHSYKTPYYSLMFSSEDYPGGEGSKGSPKGGEARRVSAIWWAWQVGCNCSESRQLHIRIRRCRAMFPGSHEWWPVQSRHVQRETRTPHVLFMGNYGRLSETNYKPQSETFDTGSLVSQSDPCCDSDRKSHIWSLTRGKIQNEPYARQKWVIRCSKETMVMRNMQEAWRWLELMKTSQFNPI